MSLLPLLLLVTVAQDKPVICLDPGHPSEVGRGTSGKSISEMRAVWLVTKELQPLLEKIGYKVVITKSSEEEFVRNKFRAEIANKSNANLLLRLHCDAANEGGFATFFPARQGKVDGIIGPSHAVLEQSRAVAQPFHQAAIEVLKGSLADRGVRNESKTAIGAKQGALTGSIYSQVPVLLVEMAVLSQEKDDRFMASSAGRKKMARALAAGVKAAVRFRASGRMR